MKMGRDTGLGFFQTGFQKTLFTSLVFIGSLFLTSAAHATITTLPTEEHNNLAIGTTPVNTQVADNGDAVATVPLQLIPGVAGFWELFWK